jgi:tetratricopeptide (TPR) repeat protein
MSRLLQNGRLLILAGMLSAGFAAPAAADDSLNVARELYASANYEDALAMLNRLRPPSGGIPEDRAVEQYRALCLLALGRNVEAQRAIEVVVAAEPSFQPSETEVSPRVRSAFSDVRRRMLPAIIQQKYGLAKSAFDRKDFAVAADGFGQVAEMLSDPDVGAAANQPPLSDLRTLAAGFRDLSVSAATPPPPPPAAPAPVAEAAPPVRHEPRAPVAPRIFSAEDGTVVPPSVVRQTLPPFPAKAFTAAQGALAILVDERGAVESVAMLLSLGPLYDRILLDSAKGWRYKPAMLDGVPVKYRRVVQVNLAPASQR